MFRGVNGNCYTNIQINLLLKMKNKLVTKEVSYLTKFVAPRKVKKQQEKKTQQRCTDLIKFTL